MSPRTSQGRGARGAAGQRGGALTGEVVWHDLECGSYDADLELWRELAEGAGGRRSRVLDVGAGTGRVSLDLAARGHDVTALDADGELLGALRVRAAAHGLEVDRVSADARSFTLAASFDLAIAPMQLVELLHSPAERASLYGRARHHLPPGGLFAAAVLDLAGEPLDGDYEPPLPDMCERDGWVFSSHPIAIRSLGGRSISLDRVRRVVSPSGDMEESESRVRLDLVPPEELERELESAGLVPVERRRIPATRDHVGSAVVVARRPGGGR